MYLIFYQLGGVNNLGTPFIIAHVIDAGSGDAVGSCKLPVFPFIYEDGHVLQNWYPISIGGR